MKCVLIAGLVCLIASVSLADGYLNDFESDGEVYVEGYFDGTSVTVYSATRDALEEVDSFSLSAGQKKTLQLPEGKYLLEANHLLRLTGEVVDEVEQPAPPPEPEQPVYRGLLDGEPVPPKVYAVRWRGTLPHETYNGRKCRVKAYSVAGSSALSRYKWDLSDGYTTGWLSGAGPNYQLDHTFPNAPEGQPWTATISVEDTAGLTASAQYRIVVKPADLDTKRNIAIDDGLWYLHRSMIRSTSGGHPTGYWRAQNALNAYYMGATGMAVTAFENSGFLPDGDPTDPYTETVQRGLNYLFSRMYRHNFTEADKWFDMNANGYGFKTDCGRTFYAGGVVLLAVSGARNGNLIVPNGISATGNTAIHGRTYRDVAQEMSDYFGGGQYDSGNGMGGWRYSYNEWPDMSAVQWPVLGMHAAEENMQVQVHETVRTRLRTNWLVYDQYNNPGNVHDGGFGYAHPYDNVNVTKTAAGLACFWWTEQLDQTGTKQSKAIAYIGRNWSRNSSSEGNVGKFYPMYAVMKGARLAVPEIEMFGSHDWYAEYSNWIVTNQQADGFWNDNDTWIAPYLGPHMRTAMAVLIMTTAVTTQPPVALFNITPNPADVGWQITFNASASYDPDPEGGELKLNWVFGDGNTAGGEIVTHTYTEYPAAGDEFTVTLTVSNSAAPPKSGIAAQQMRVLAGNHPPVADAGGPYHGWIGPATKPPVQLDGTGSYEIDEGDSITTYAWELDGVYDPVGGYDFDEALTAIAQWTWETPGEYDIALRVGDDPDSGLPNAGQTAVEWTVVTIELDNTPPTANLAIDPAEPDGANGWYVSQPVVSISASDDESGMKAIRYWWADDDPTDVPGDSAEINAPSGDLLLHYGGVDNVDNFAEDVVAIKTDLSTSTAAITLDGTGPNNGWYSSAVEVTLTADAGPSGVATAEKDIDGAGWVPVTLPDTFTIDVQGDHTVAVRFTTVSGKEAAADLAFKIDSIAPESTAAVTPDAPTGANGWYVTVPTIDITATDAQPGSGVATIVTQWDANPPAAKAGSSVSVQPLEGEHTLAFFASDFAGNNEAAQTIAIKLDTSTPKTGIGLDGDGPHGDGWYHSAVDATLSANGGTSGIAAAEVKIDDAEWAPFTNGQVINIGSDGAHTVSTRLTTNSGKEATAETSFSIDQTPPATTLATDPAAPDGNEGWFVTLPQITLTASDAGGEAIAEIHYWWDGEDEVIVPGNTAVFDGNTSAANLNFYAVNENGNPEEPQAAEILIDLQAPNATAAFDPPADGDNGWHLTQATISIWASDIGIPMGDPPIRWIFVGQPSGVKLIRYHWDDDPAQEQPGAEVTLTAPAGEHTLHFQAVDVAGNEMAWDSVVSKYDDSTVTVDIALAGTNEPGGFYTGTVDATLTADGGMTGLATTQYRINGSAWIDFVSNDIVSISGEGTNTIEAKAVAVSGKTANATETFIIDNGPPATAMATIPAAPDGNDGWFLSQPQVKLTAVDAGVGVKEIHYWWEGSPEVVAPGASAQFPAPAGINTLHYFAVDLFDQIEATHDAEVKYDASTPGVAIELAGPLAGPGWYKGDITATVVPDGDGVAVASVETSIDSAAWTDYVDPVVVSGEGSHMVQARIVTANGKIASAKALFTIDFNPPTTTLATTPAAPNGLDGWFITRPSVTLTATDLGSSVREIHYWWNDGGVTVVPGKKAVLSAPDGINTLHYFAVDVHDLLEAAQEFVIKYDASTPGVAIELAGPAGGAGWYSGDVTATVLPDGNGVAVVSTQCKIDGTAWTDYTDPVVVTGEGSHTVQARIGTATGKTAQTSTTFIIDTNPPTTTLATTPAAPNGLDGWFITRPSVALSATDLGGGVREIHYWWNDDAETVVAGRNATVSAPDGINTLHYFAVDVYDQAEAPRQAEIKYDASAPSVTIELAGAAGGAGWYESAVDATLTADGDGVAIASVEIRVDSTPYVGYFDPVTVTGEGLHNVYARATNIYGKVAQSSVQFMIDYNPPTTILATDPQAPNGYDDWFISQPSVTLTAGDAGVGVDRIYYWWNDQPAVFVETWSVRLNAPGGVNTLHYYAVDDYGHAEAEKTAEIKYDDSSPSVTVQLAGTGGPDWFTSDVEVTLLPDGDGVPVALTEIRIEAGSWQPYTVPVNISGEGSHAIYGRVTNARGKQETASRSFVIDVNAPNTTATTTPAGPDGLDGWYVSQPQVHLRSTDAGGGVKEIRYWWNDDAPTVAAGSAANFPAPGGTNVLHYFAVDVYDQQEAEQQIQIKYDDTPVAIDIALAGEGGPAWFSGDVQATIGTTGPVEIVQVRVDGAALWESYAGPIDLTIEGDHSVAARAITATGKTAQTTSAFGIDLQPPASSLSVSPISPDSIVWGWYSTVPTVRINSLDAGSGVAQIRYQWDGGPETVVPGATATTKPAQGMHVLTYWAIDKLGRTEAPKQETFRVDSQPPAIATPSRDPQSPDVDDDVEISVEVTDAMGVQIVSLWYTYGTIWTRQPMGRTPGTDTYTATIPASVVAKKVQYQINATDLTGNEGEVSGFWYYTGSVDLTVSAITYSGDLRDGGASKVAATIYNKGSNSLQNEAIVELFVDGKYKSQATVNDIPSLGGKTVDLPWTRTAGTHNILVRVDSDNRIPEVLEDNNERTATVDVAIPNLIAENLVAPTAITAGSSVTFSFDVRAEVGTARTSTAAFKIGNGTIGSISVGPLNTGQTVNVKATWLASGGSHVLTALADAGSVVPESNEADNMLQQALPAIEKPDFVVDSFQVSPADPLPGNTVALEAVVRNAGADYLAGVSVRFTCNGSIVGSMNIPGMTAGQASTVNASWTAQPGNNVLQVIVDPANHIAESNETNNTGSATADVPGLAIAPNFVNVWSNEARTLTFNLLNSGSVVLNITELSSSRSWLTPAAAVPFTLMPGQTASLPFDLDPLPGGSHNVSIGATSVTPNGRNLAISAPVTISAAEVTASYEVSLAANTNVSRGQQVGAVLTVRNTSNQSGVFDIALSGAAAPWAVLSVPRVTLGINQQTTISILVRVPGAPAPPATAVLQADVSRAGTALSRSASVTFNMSAGPIISSLDPADGTTLGANTVAFHWQTNLASSTSVFLREKPQGDPVVNEWTELTGAAGVSHHVASHQLARDKWYEFYAESSTAYGTTSSGIRSFFVARGVVFVSNSFNFTIERDYDQRRDVKIRNNDILPHQVLVSVENVPEQFIVGFVGSGSQDQLLTLNPGQTATVALVMHAQDVVDPNLSFTAKLNNFGIHGENEEISDSALVNVNVHFVNFDFSVTETGTNPTTLAKTFRVTNLGDAVTDISVSPGGDLAGMTMFDPVIEHGYLPAGGSVTFTVSPSLYVGFTSLAGTIAVRGGNHSVVKPVQFTLPDGMGVYVGVIGGIPPVPSVDMGVNVYVDDMSANTLIVEIGDGNDSCTTTVQVSSQPAAAFAPPQFSFYTDGQGRQCAMLVIVTQRPDGGWLEWTMELIGLCDSAYQLPGMNILIAELLYMAEWQLNHGFINPAQFQMLIGAAHHIWPIWEVIRPWLNPQTGDVSDPEDSGPGGGTGSTTTTSDQGASDAANDAAENNGQPNPPSPGGSSPYNGPGASTSATSSNWYCTNRPRIGNRVGIGNNANGRGGQWPDWLKDHFNQEAERRRKLSFICLGVSAYGMFDAHRDPTNPFSIPTSGDQPYIDAARGAIDIARSAGQYRRMANDPPNPLYTLISPPAIPDAADPIGPISDMYLISYDVSQSAVAEEKLVEAMVDAMEAAKGAQDAGDDLWYKRQGRILRKLTDLCHEQQRQSAAALRQLAQAMQARWPGGFGKAEIQAIQQRVAETGLTVTETERLLEVIKDPGLIPGFIDWFTGLDFSDMPADAIGALEEEAAGVTDLAAQLSDHKIYNPDVQNVQKVFLTGTFSLPWPPSTYHPHNVDVLVNNNLAAKLSDTIPNGSYNWEIDPSFLIYADQGVADNYVSFETTHLNGGHYVVSEKVELTLQLTQIAIPVIAANQEQANQAVYNVPGVSQGAPDVAIFKGDIVLLGEANDRDSVTVRVRVRNLGTAYADATNVGLYLGDPESGGELLGETTMSLVPFGEQPMDVVWKPAAAGEVVLYAVASAADGEIVTTNNKTCETVNVQHIQGGDINADGKLNILDMIALRNLLNSDSTAGPHADLNGDGRINILDLIQLRLLMSQ